MKSAIVEREGAMLRVCFEPATPPELPTLLSVHVCDDQYRPVGPNIALMLSSTYVMSNLRPGPNGEPTADATSFMSSIMEEVNGSR